MEIFRTESLANDIELMFFDGSNRYFGDYHRVCVEIRLRVSPDGPILMIRQLERMAVPGAETEAVRNRLVDDFMRHAGRYLAHPDYPAKLLAREKTRAGRSRWQ